MNKARLILLLAVLILAGALSAATARTDYARILTRLQALERSGVENADLYYNLGVCHYQLGDSGQAVLWWLRALNLNSAHRAARENLSYIESTQPTGAPPPQRPFLARLTLNIYDFFNLNRLALIFLILFLLSALALIWLINYPPQKEHGLPILVLGVLLFLLLLFGGTLLAKNYRRRHNPRAVVCSGTAEVYAAPRAARAVQYLAEGAVVLLRRGEKGWSQVILADGSGGWMRGSSLQRVVPERGADRPGHSSGQQVPATPKDTVNAQS